MIERETTGVLPLERIAAAQVVDALPSAADYTRHYQPDYSDPDALLDAVHELHETKPVTTPRQIDNLQAELTKLATGEIDRPIILTGRCGEEIDATVPIERLVENAVNERALVLSGVRKAIVIQRNRGQYFKPRSAATERKPDGGEVVSYMGDGINGRDIHDRDPDPTRLVAGAVQARDLEAGLAATVGEHVPAAHEALSLPYDQSFVRIDTETGKKYLVSTDMPWLGKRTNALSDPDGGPNPHLELLAEVANPIGVKIGPDSTPEHIAGLQAKLNPDNIPGRIIFMLRMGLSQNEQLQAVASAIRTHAPNALIMYDIHGVTRTAPTGEKIRYTGDIIANIAQTAAACRQVGLKLHGLHLETTPDDARLECVDYPDQLPTHPGGVDPQLNPRQLRHVLTETQEYLL